MDCIWFVYIDFNLWQSIILAENILIESSTHTFYFIHVISVEYLSGTMHTSLKFKSDTLVQWLSGKEEKIETLMPSMMTNTLFFFNNNDDDDKKN